MYCPLFDDIARNKAKKSTPMIARFALPLVTRYAKDAIISAPATKDAVIFCNLSEFSVLTISFFLKVNAQPKEATIPIIKKILNIIGSMPSMKYPFTISKEKIKDKSKSAVVIKVKSEVALWVILTRCLKFMFISKTTIIGYIIADKYEQIVKMVIFGNVL